jgi:hypothetical protein
MPIVAIVVGVVGSAVGTAIGAAIGGTLLGVGAATIGGIIGAGIAGGLVSKMSGGDFGKGFLMGAVGGAVGKFLSGGLGEALGTGATEGGNTVASMLAEQGGAEFAPNALDSVSWGAGDMGQGALADSGVETFGLGETAASTGVDGTALDPVSFEELYPVPDSTDYGIDMTDPSNMGLMKAEQNLNQMANINQSADYMWNNDRLAYSAATQGAEPFSYTQTPAETGSFSLENIGAPTPTPTSGGLEGVGQATEAGSLFQNESLLSKDVPYGQNATWTSSTQPAAPIVDRSTTQPWTNKATNMATNSDDWLSKTFGTPKGSVGKMAMGSADSLMKLYGAYQQDQLVKGTKPLSFEDFQKQYSNEADYRQAASSMGRQGRTGALPALLARMKQRDRNAYANYLPNARQQYVNNKANVNQAYTGALHNLFAPAFGGAK